MVLRHPHWLLRLLKLRVVVNAKDIYECEEKQPAVINSTAPMTSIQVTNGFHSSRVVGVKNEPGTHFYEVAGFVDNMQLLTGILMTLLFFTLYIFTGSRLFMLFANLPLLIMLYLLYVKRKSFICIYKMRPQQKH